MKALLKFPMVRMFPPVYLVGLVALRKHPAYENVWVEGALMSAWRLPPFKWPTTYKQRHPDAK